MSEIHQLAIVHPKARVGQDVRIGPFSIIEEGAEIGDNCELMQDVFVAAGTRIGRGNRIHMGAVIGHDAQHRQAEPGGGAVTVGNNNVIREYVTIHRSFQRAGRTVVGNDNYFMAHAHVGHDCVVGNGVTLVNGALLGGHVIVEDGAFISGNAAVHQHCRIGRFAMVGGCGTATKDVPPYMLIDDNGDRIASINLVAMKRAGLTPEAVVEIKKAYRMLYFSGLTAAAAAKEIRQVSRTAEAQYLAEFLTQTRRGILPHRREALGEEETVIGRES